MDSEEWQKTRAEADIAFERDGRERLSVLYENIIDMTDSEYYVED